MQPTVIAYEGTGDNRVHVQTTSGRTKHIELTRDEAIGLAARLLECALRLPKDGE